MKIFNQGCVNVIWSRGSISEIFVNVYHEFVCGYREVVGIRFLRSGVKRYLRGFRLEFVS